MNGKKYIFGPVPSRRLGISLGVDLVRAKTCPLDCVYCEAGATTDLTIERREYVPVDEVLRQLDEYLSKEPELDYVTFSGAGEPTLNSRIGEVVAMVRERYPHYRLCLLTNGCLLDDEKLIEEIAGVDLVIPSLDASTEEEFIRIGRPVPGYTLTRLVDALVSFRQKFRGAYWLELFIVPGVNDSEASVQRFIELVKRIAPDKVQLNTLDRPGCVDWITAAPEATVMHFLEEIGKVMPVESVGKYRHRRFYESSASSDLRSRIVELVERRPCTAADIAASLGISPGQAEADLEKMAGISKLKRQDSPRGVFYSAVVSGSR